MDPQLYCVFSVLFKNKNLKHWLRVVPKFKLNGAKTFTSLKSEIRNGITKCKRPTCLNGPDQIMSECVSGRTNQSEVDGNLRKLADLLNFTGTSDKLGLMLLQQQSLQ